MTHDMQLFGKTAVTSAVTCEFCGTHCDPLYEVTLGQDVSTMFRCAACAACRVWPAFPEEAVRAHYEKSYFRLEPQEIEKGRILAADYLTKVAQAAAGRPITGRALEIGAGYGFFARAVARETGSSVDVVEPSVSCRTYMQEQGTPGRVYASLDDVPADLRYDEVFCFHVMEHLQGCADFSRRVAQMLADDGRFWILTPNAASRSFRLTGAFWGWSGRDQHYQFLPQTYPDDYWRDLGLRLIQSRDIVPADHHYPSHWHAWARKHAARLGGQDDGHPRRGSIAHRLQLAMCEWLARFVRQWPGYDGYTFERRWEEFFSRAPHDELMLVLAKAAARRTSVENRSLQ